jgi:hypothetical protein
MNKKGKKQISREEKKMQPRFARLCVWTKAFQAENNENNKNWSKHA